MVMRRNRKNRIGSAFSKDIFREIFKTKNRFLSIFLIVAIGVGFFGRANRLWPGYETDSRHLF